MSDIPFEIASLGEERVAGAYAGHDVEGLIEVPVLDEKHREPVARRVGGEVVRVGLVEITGQFHGAVAVGLAESGGGGLGLIDPRGIAAIDLHLARRPPCIR